MVLLGTLGADASDSRFVVGKVCRLTELVETLLTASQVRLRPIDSAMAKAQRNPKDLQKHSKATSGWAVRKVMFNLVLACGVSRPPRSIALSSHVDPHGYQGSNTLDCHVPESS